MLYKTEIIISSYIACIKEFKSTNLAFDSGITYNKLQPRITHTYALKF